MSRLREAARQLLPAACALSDVVSDDELHRGTVELLSSLIACDDVLWTEVDVVRSQAVVSHGPMACPDENLALVLASRGVEHPAVASYVTANDDRQPRRVSDLVVEREWLSSAIYAEAFRQDRARFQLSLVLDLNQGVGRGWTLTRSLRDFNDKDLDVASLALPCLILIDKLSTVRKNISKSPGLHESRSGDVHLTDRENQILRLLATGLKASAIGRAVGVSEATVRKHIEHIFVKVGSHDRLTAVLRAQELGYLD